jgi:cytochrome P450
MRAIYGSSTPSYDCTTGHCDEELFPEPEQYEPERWIDAQGKPNYSMEKYIMSFSKGSRQCIGMQ